MSDDGVECTSRFTRVPRAAADAAPDEIARVKFSDSLDAIETFLHHAVEGGRKSFGRNSPAYASGSMAIIRTAALFETDEFTQRRTIHLPPYLDAWRSAVHG